VPTNRSRIEVAHEAAALEPLKRLGGILLHDRWLFGFASVVAIAVTALQRIPEVFAGGYEVGVFVAALAFAYVGAWIFNWVIIERPRTAQLRDIYRVSWPALSLAAWDGYYLIKELAWMAKVDELKEPAEYDVQQLCSRIPWGVYIDGVDWRDSLNNHLDIRNARQQAIAPFLAHAEHHLLTILAELNATDYVILHPIGDWSDNGEPIMVYSQNAPPRQSTLGDLGNHSKHVREYFASTEKLRRCLENLKHAPGPVGPGLRSANAKMWEDRTFGHDA
jgi:hypothetical protein